MNVIECGGVSKRYRRSVAGGPRRLRDLGLSKQTEQWALRDVTMVAREGESIGLIGHNGSGKSTLLRVIANVTKPTTGYVRHRGVIGGLLTLGSGLDSSLSARENAITGAIMAGVPRSQVPALLPKIAAFAELEEVFHEPMRTFSDGMRLRLAFATSIHVSPRIMLIDEILAVGDARFREKCFERLQTLRKEGTTFIVVSHSLSQVEQFCDRVLWLDHGRVRLAGPTDEVLSRYEESNVSNAEERPATGEQRRFGTGELVALDSIELLRPTSRVPLAVTRTGQPMRVRFSITRKSATISEARISLSIHRGHDFSRPLDISSVVPLSGLRTEVSVDLDRLDFGKGEYWVNGGVFSPDWTDCYDYLWQAVALTVDGPSEPGAIVPPLRWSHDIAQSVPDDQLQSRTVEVNEHA